MSDFWIDKVVKARKEHRCHMCGKLILKGEEYNNGSGRWDGFFCGTDLCLVCKAASDKYELFYEYNPLPNIYDIIRIHHLIKCPQCKETCSEIDRVDDTSQKYQCECSQCDRTWVVTLSADMFKPDDQDAKQTAGLRWNEVKE